MIDMPQPKSEAVLGWQGQSKVSTEHRFWDRTNKIETTSMVVLAAFDMAQTCHNLASTETVITHLTTPRAPGGYVDVPITLHGHEHRRNNVPRRKRQSGRLTLTRNWPRSSRITSASGNRDGCFLQMPASHSFREISSEIPSIR
jgi:hypothetical protein